MLLEQQQKKVYLTVNQDSRAKFKFAAFDKVKQF